MHGSIIPLALVAAVGIGPPTVSAAEGRPFHGVVAQDAACAGATARIDWGDATPVVPGETAVDGTVTGGHTYTHAGDYDIKTTCSLAAIVTLHTPAHVTAAPAPSPTATPSPTPTATPVPTVAHTPPTAQAVFIAPVSGRPRSSVTLDAGLSSGAVAYQWDVGANDTVDASCLGGQPRLTTRLPSSGALDVALTTIDASGARSTVRHTIAVSGGTTARAAAVRAGQRVFICGAGAGQHPGDLTAQGGPPADCTTSVQFGLVDAIGCLRPLTDLGVIPSAERRMLLNHQKTTAFPSGVAGQHALRVDDQITRETLRLNGLDIEPQPGAVVLLLPAQDRVLSSDAVVRVGGVVLQRGQLSLKLPAALGRFRLGDFDLPASPRLVGGLRPVGMVSVDLLYHRAEVTVHLRLPDGFTTPDGHFAQAEVKAKADDPLGFKLRDAEMQAPDALLGGVELPNFAVTYDPDKDEWEGVGKISPLFDHYAIDMKIGFRKGRFGHLDVDVEPPDPGLAVGNGIFMTKVGAGLQLDPKTILSGHITLSAGGKYAGCNAVDVDGAFALQTDPAPADLKLTGTLTLACFAKIAQATFEARADGFVQFAGHLNLPLIPWLLTVEANLDGRYEDPHFQVDVDGKVCWADLACVGGEIVASDAGAGACADFDVWHPGGGVKFNPFRVVIEWSGCNISQFRSLARTAQAGGVQTVTVERAGVPLALRFAGDGGAPRMALIAPDGTRLTAPAHTADHVAYHDVTSGHTYFLLTHPMAGTWRVEPEPGSPRVTEVARAGRLADPQVHARVVGHGRRRTLVYRVRRIPGQVVRFADDGRATLGTTRRTSGRLRFLVPRGGGRHRIVAHVIQDGAPRTDITVARFGR